MELSDLRREIDTIDGEILNLFCQRMEIAAKIADYKQAHQLPVLVPEREKEVLEAVAQKAGPDMAQYAIRLFETIMAQSRNYQRIRLGTDK